MEVNLLKTQKPEKNYTFVKFYLMGQDKNNCVSVSCRVKAEGAFVKPENTSLEVPRISYQQV